MLEIRSNSLAALFCTAVLLVPASVRADEGGDQYTVAAAHYRAGRWKLAVDEFQTLLSGHASHRDSNRGRFLLGESLVQLGEFDEASRHYQEYLKVQPEGDFAAQALFRLGETAYLRGKTAEAKPHLKAFRARFSENALSAYVLTYLAEIALAENDVETASLRLDESLKRFPKGPLADDCRLGQARVLQLQNKVDEAAAAFRAIAENRDSPAAGVARYRYGVLRLDQEKYAEAAETFAALLSEHPRSSLVPKARYRLGMARKGERNFTEAARLLIEAADRHSEHPWAPAMVFHAGDSLLEAGENDAAAEQFDRVATKWPASSWADDALLGAIDAASAAGSHDAVSERFEEMLRRFPKSTLLPGARRSAGRSLLSQEKYEQARRILEPLLNESTALANSAETAASRHLLATAYHGLGKHNEALALLDQVVETGSGELRAAALAARGEILLAAEKYREAVQSLEAYLEGDASGPLAARCWANLALARTHLGEFDQAKHCYGQLAEHYHEQRELLAVTTHHLAELAYRAEQPQWAAALFGWLADAGTNAGAGAQGLSGLAWSQFMQGQYRQAAETFGRLIDAYPNDPLVAEATLMRGRSLERLGRPDAALVMYQQTLRQPSGGTPVAEATLAAASIHESRRRHAEAATLYRNLLKQQPDLPKRDVVLYRLAWALVDSDKHEEADSVWEQIHTHQGSSALWADATYRLAQRRHETGKLDEAARLVAQVMAAKPDERVHAYALYLQSQIAVARERWEDVAASLEKLLAEHKQSSVEIPARFWIAEASYRLGKYDEAKTHYDALQPVAEERKESWLAMIPLRRAQLAARAEQWTDAREIAATIARTFPNFSQQYEADYLLGRCHAAAADFVEARNAYRRVVRSPQGGTTETAAMAQWMIGETFFHQKGYDDAIKEYLRVEALYDYPRWNAAALLQAGKCYEKLGRWQEATKLYAQITKKYPNTTFTDDAARRMRVAR